VKMAERAHAATESSGDSTRTQVARAILEGGPATAADLAQRLAMTPAGIRRHLDALIEEGVLSARDPYQIADAQRGRGRPSKVFVMTDVGREKFEHSYDDLAVAALKFMSSQSGEALVEKFARSRAEDFSKRIKPLITERQSMGEKSAALAEFLTTEGYAASMHPRALGEELCQNHCPIAHVASQFPELCDAETEFISELLGTHVQRLATIAHGDGVCTTYIPHAPTVSSAGLAASITAMSTSGKSK
jgi:predicted ArsR family transcriptional regulator